MVYEDADAALQLKGFYDEVASPLLSDIQLSYVDDQAFDVTRSLFPNYFQGSELVVTGRVKPGVKDLKVSVSATDSKQRIRLENDVFIFYAMGNESADSVDCSGGLEGISSIVHRLWAYFTIKELLLAKLNSTDPATQRLLADKATNLSLKYNFVTPVTSLVVVKPDADEVPQTQTTAHPTAVTMTTTTSAATKISAGAPKKLNSPSNPRPPQPPPGTSQIKKKLTPKSVAKNVVSPHKKTTTTSNPSSTKTAKAPLFGRKPQNESKTDSGKLFPSLLKALKTAAPPAPGKVSPLQSSSQKTTTPSVITSTTTPPLSSARTDPAPLPGRPLTSQLGNAKITLPPVKGTLSETRPTPAPDVTQPETIRASPLAPPTPASAPAEEHNGTDLSIATLVSAMFAPMPGATDGPRLWEAAGLLGKLYTY